MVPFFEIVLELHGTDQGVIMIIYPSVRVQALFQGLRPPEI